jgi:hypothetical protein
MNTIKTLLLLVGILLCVAFANVQDVAKIRPVVVNLKEGNPVCGNLVSADQDTLTVEVGGARTAIDLDAVTGVAFLPGKTKAGLTSKGTVRAKRLSEALTSLYLDQMLVKANVDGELKLSIFATQNGRDTSELNTVELHLFLTGNNQIFRDATRLTLTLDGEQFASEETIRYEPQAVCGFYSEHLSSSLSPNMFLRLASARKVEAQVGSIKFELTDEQLSSLRDMVKLASTGGFK